MSLPVGWAFTRAKQHPETLLIHTINSAVSTLDVAIYSLTYPDIVDAIRTAKLRGVQVRLITDKHESVYKQQEEALKWLGSAGIPFKVNTHSGLMHLTIADQKIVTTGSFNYSKAASTVNDEVLFVIHSQEAAESFTAEFESMWDHAKKYETVELNNNT